MSSKDSAYAGRRSYKSTATARPSGSEHTRQHVEHSRRDPEPSKPNSERSKRDTDHYLQYYQSSLADGQAGESDEESSRSRELTRQTSRGSTSPSDYSDEPATDFSMNAARSVTSTRRSKAPTDGGSDRRRLAIVQMDPLGEPPPSKSKDALSLGSSVRARRGLPANLAGLALVAPPDAAPSTYSHLTPPTTAPATGDLNVRHATREDKGHNRSSSEAAQGAKDSSRSAGSFGAERPANSTERARPRVVVESDSLSPPGDQRSQHSRSPSPGAVSDVSDQARGLLSPVQHARPGMTRGDTQQSVVLTPEIGEEKDIAARVAAPVVINLESAEPFRRRDASSRNGRPHVDKQPVSPTSISSRDTSSYLHYQPGIHAIAGPLPPPPRAMFNIDTNSPAPPRPPRLNSPLSIRSRGDIEAVKQALQLPPSVTAALASRTPKPKPVKSTESLKAEAASLDQSTAEPNGSRSTDDPELQHVKSVHRREGAFAPSVSTSTATTLDSNTPASRTSSRSDITPSDRPHDDAKIVDDTKAASSRAANEDVPPITVIHLMQPIDEQQEQGVNGNTADLTSSPSARRRSDDLSSEGGSRSRSPPYTGHTGEAPSPPPKSFRNSLTTNFKRLSSSLPRTPSLSSKSRRSSGGTYYSSRTPSPSIMVSPPPVRQKIKHQYPPAMFYAEITTRKTSLERCMLYAQKINELYMYDSGLGDWTIETKMRANNNRPTVAFSSHTFTPQPRHTSRASMISEATFPRRPDASTATDLSVKTQDLAPPTPPALPYPALANQRAFPARSSSVTSGTPSSSLRSLAPSTPTSKSSGGFFASLGRKASMTSSKKDKPAPSAPSTTAPARLTKNPPASAAARVINISNAPTVPGGPRAAPGHRAARSQTIMTTTAPFAASNTPPAERGEALGRRPSLYDINSESVINISADAEFVRQVDKLVHLLPDADRDVLAGYLRRAGQDILAIGQYLEDEKNGKIKPP
ncbi:hypothetical protein LshimejAT787_0104080 [Lyophyllum shimeji]|uniref:Uncharacterized protein n=1 Tax=Lyophyllum shimeji TaxID=47721 RepID=A0A9P3PDK5_LYOSH|nr:hypothetical protein LshimejAT787_0104080 [Lyophyllum shimeji]